MYAKYFLTTIGLVATLIAVGCSSDKATDNTSPGSGVYNPGGGAGNTNDGTVLAPGQGMTQITQQVADSYNGTACAGQSAEPEPTASLLEFVLDVSGTMTHATAATNGLSKWQVVANSMATALATLPDTQAVGETFFPNADNGGAQATPSVRNNGACIDQTDNVAIAKLAAAQMTLLTNTLNGIVPFPNGATPTQDALKIAYDNLNQSQIPGAKYAVLITDGQPTLSLGCYGLADPRNPNDATPIITDIGYALTPAGGGIKTFIIGSPGSESNSGTGADVRGWLSDAAVAGGTRLSATCSNTGTPSFCHFDMTTSQSFGTALTAALVQIGSSVVSCDYTVPTTSLTGDPIDPNKVNIIYTSGTGEVFAVGRNTASDCQTGWHYTDTTSTKIHICGDSCSTMLADAKASLRLYYGCASPILVK